MPSVSACLDTTDSVKSGQILLVNHRFNHPHRALLILVSPAPVGMDTGNQLLQAPIAE